MLMEVDMAQITERNPLGLEPEDKKALEALVGQAHGFGDNPPPPQLDPAIVAKLRELGLVKQEAEHLTTRGLEILMRFGPG